MKPWARWAVLAGTVAVVVVLFVVLRPEAVEDDASPSPRTPTATTDTSSPSPSPSPEPEITVIEVTVRGGTVQGPRRPSVTQGEDVRIVVRADVSDHVHLHGYDLMTDVGPGMPARIDFVADAAGVFEVELEDAALLLFELEIVP